MLDKVYLGPRVSSLDIGEPAARISRVNLLVDSEHMYTAGDDSGRTIEKTCPWGTQAMANSILASLRDVDYRPYTGQDGLLDPAAEVGDGVTVGETYSVLAQTDILFDALCSVDAAAPGGDEIEDEYPYKSRARRQADRQLARVYSTITKTSERITLLVANEVEGLEGKLELTASSLTSEINNTRDGLNSRIEQTASSLTTEINNTEAGLNSKIEQTASSLSAQISSAQGDISNLQITASDLAFQINGAQGDISSLQQTASNLSFTASAQGNQISALFDAVNGFSLSVTNGSASSTLALMSGRTVLSSAEIVLRGAVTFEDLSSEGRSVINGGNISTGTIYADDLSLSGEFTLRRGYNTYGWLGLGQGYDGVSTTYGPMLSGGSNCYVIATGSGVRMTEFRGASIFVADGGCYASSDFIIPSDRRLKEDIDYDIDCYKAFFRALRPCRFLMSANPAEGYHTGFIAQEVDEAMRAANLSQMDFAGLASFRQEGGGERMALRYSEFIALNTLMIHPCRRNARQRRKNGQGGPCAAQAGLAEGRQGRYRRPGPTGACRGDRPARPPGPGAFT